jgi:CcmD family protein
MAHLIIAYTIVFGVILGYVVSLVRRQEALRRELDALKRRPNHQSSPQLRSRGG